MLNLKIYMRCLYVQLFKKQLIHLITKMLAGMPNFLWERRCLLQGFVQHCQLYKLRAIAYDVDDFFQCEVCA